VRFAKKHYVKKMTCSWVINLTWQFISVKGVHVTSDQHFISYRSSLTLTTLNPEERTTKISLPKTLGIQRKLKSGVQLNTETKDEPPYPCPSKGYLMVLTFPYYGFLTHERYNDEPKYAFLSYLVLHFRSNPRDWQVTTKCSTYSSHTRCVVCMEG
jgi:hypothetical protein